MLDRSTLIADALRLFIICVMACSTGCKGAPDSSSVSEIRLRVIQEVYHGEGWTTAGEIIVMRDNSYEHTILDLSNPTSASRTKGILPGAIMLALENDVAKKTRFEVKSGVATYRYGIDDITHRWPPGLAQLLSFLTEKEDVIEGASPSGADKSAPPDLIPRHLR